MSRDTGRPKPNARSPFLELSFNVITGARVVLRGGISHTSFPPSTRSSRQERSSGKSKDVLKMPPLVKSQLCLGV